MQFCLMLVPVRRVARESMCCTQGPSILRRNDATIVNSYLRPILGLSLLSDLFWIWFNIRAKIISASLVSTLFVGSGGLQTN